MFARACLASKYKAYSKSVRNLQQNKLIKQNAVELLQRLECVSTNNATSQEFKVSFQQNRIIKRITATLLQRLESSSPKSTAYQELKKIKLDCGLFKNCSRVLSSIQEKFKFPSLEKKQLFAGAGIVSATTAKTPTEAIPEPPPVPSETAEAVPEILNQINALGEPTFASLGLGGYSPVGIAQTCFEYLHVSLGIPWWEAIVLGTLVIRFCMFPLVVIAQRNAAKMNNYMPQMQAIQLKMTEARQTGNQLEVARYSQELMIFMREKQLNPFKNMVVPLAQMPVFISFFMSLRQMANVPVDSLRTGGLWWFTDLTVPDQFFLMPLITSATLYATIELGTDSAKLSAQNLQTMKYVLRALPLVILPFIVNFPGVILCYWVSSNFISLIQVGILRIPAVREYFKIEQLVTHKPENLPMKPKGFTEGIKDSWTNLKITKELEERRRLDEIQFQRAGKGPIVKTYKFDPTKQGSPASISVKKR